MTNERPRQRDVAPDGGSESLGSVGDRTGESGPRQEDSNAELMSNGKREFLLEAVRRAPLLESLQREPATPGDLQETVEMSRSTVHRAIDSLRDDAIIQQSSGKYELTRLGEILVEELRQFGERTWTARSLTEFLNSVTMDGNGIPVEHLSDATVIRREPRRPHATIHRIMELFERADNVRMFSTVISPIYVDMAYPKLMNGMQIQAVFEREIVDMMLSEFPRKAYETIATGNFDVYAYDDDLPFELFIFDDEIGMAAHNQEGIAEVLIECDDPAARAWAEELYQEHRTEAESLTVSDV